MSKGSKQRPGTGYADNWDRIFKKDTKVLLNRAKQHELTKTEKLHQISEPDSVEPVCKGEAK